MTLRVMTLLQHSRQGGGERATEGVKREIPTGFEVARCLEL